MIEGEEEYERLQSKRRASADSIYTYKVHYNDAKREIDRLEELIDRSLHRAKRGDVMGESKYSHDEDEIKFSQVIS